jgi:predicted murein hydrolase (TIGR00659 family)
MTFHLSSAWNALLVSPVWGLLATLLAYRVGQWVNQRARGHPVANPVLVAVALLVGMLLTTRIPYKDYFAGAQYVHFLLGPATVALAIPMYKNLHHIRLTAKALIPALVVGSITSAASAALISKVTGAAPLVSASLVAHSATTPIAMSISEKIGGDPSLTATFTLLTGILGVLLVRIVMKFIRVEDMRAYGLASGTAGHGLTTAYVLSLNETAGAFGGLAIGLNGVFTALMAPLIASLILR